MWSVLGEVELGGENYLAVDEEKEGKYTRFLFCDNHLVGTQMIGHTELAGAVKKAIENRQDFSTILHKEKSVKGIVKLLK